MENKSARLRVYRKKSTFKGATENDFWYSATRSDGASVILKFKCPIETDSVAFEVSDVVGTMSYEAKEDNEGNVYDNYTYYVTGCKFHEIVGEPLPL